MSSSYRHPPRRSEGPAGFREPVARGVWRRGHRLHGMGGLGVDGTVEGVSGPGHRGRASCRRDGPAEASLQVQRERDELYSKFTAAILEVQQKTGLKNLLLERKLQALSAAVEKKELQLNEVLAASHLDPTTLSLVSRKLEVSARWAPGAAGWCLCSCPGRRPAGALTGSLVSC